MSKTIEQRIAENTMSAQESEIKFNEVSTAINHELMRMLELERYHDSFRMRLFDLIHKFKQEVAALNKRFDI